MTYELKQYCKPIYDSEQLTIAVLNTWEDLTKNPFLNTMTKWENVIGKKYFEESLSDGCYFFAIENYKDSIEKYSILLLKTTYLGKILKVKDSEGSDLSDYPCNFEEIISDYINTRTHPKEFTEKYKNKSKNDLNQEAYNISSELFSFKEMRRSVIEHGRVCYIEGYEKHAELFCNFLVKNGYFDDLELNKVLVDFDAYLNDVQAVSRNYAESIFQLCRKFT